MSLDTIASSFSTDNEIIGKITAIKNNPSASKKFESLSKNIDSAADSYQQAIANIANAEWEVLLGGNKTAVEAAKTLAATQREALLDLLTTVQTEAQKEIQHAAARANQLKITYKQAKVENEAIQADLLKVIENPNVSEESLASDIQGEMNDIAALTEKWDGSWTMDILTSRVDSIEEMEDVRYKVRKSIEIYTGELRALANSQKNDNLTFLGNSVSFYDNKTRLAFVRLALQKLHENLEKWPKGVVSGSMNVAGKAVGTGWDFVTSDFIKGLLAIGGMTAAVAKVPKFILWDAPGYISKRFQWKVIPKRIDQKGVIARSADWILKKTPFVWEPVVGVLNKLSAFLGILPSKHPSAASITDLNNIVDFLEKDWGITDPALLKKAQDFFKKNYFNTDGSVKVQIHIDELKAKLYVASMGNWYPGSIFNPITLPGRLWSLYDNVIRAGGVSSIQKAAWDNTRINFGGYDNLAGKIEQYGVKELDVVRYIDSALKGYSGTEDVYAELMKKYAVDNWIRSKLEAAKAFLDYKLNDATGNSEEKLRKDIWKIHERFVAIYGETTTHAIKQDIIEDACSKLLRSKYDSILAKVTKMELEIAEATDLKKVQEIVNRARAEGFDTAVITDLRWAWDYFRTRIINEAKDAISKANDITLLKEEYQKLLSDLRSGGFEGLDVTAKDEIERMVRETTNRIRTSRIELAIRSIRISDDVPWIQKVVDDLNKWISDNRLPQLSFHEAESLGLEARAEAIRITKANDVQAARDHAEALERAKATNKGNNKRGGGNENASAAEATSNNRTGSAHDSTTHQSLSGASTPTERSQESVKKAKRQYKPAGVKPIASPVIPEAQKTTVVSSVESQNVLPSLKGRLAEKIQAYSELNALTKIIDDFKPIKVTTIVDVLSRLESLESNSDVKKVLQDSKESFEKGFGKAANAEILPNSDLANQLRVIFSKNLTEGRAVNQEALALWKETLVIFRAAVRR